MEVEVAETVGVIIAALTQIASSFGKAKILHHIGVLDSLWDVIAGNYGKAKNKDE